MGRQEPGHEPQREPTWDITREPRPEPEPGISPEPGIPSEPGSTAPQGPSVPWPQAQARGPFPTYAQPGQTNGKAVISLVLAIVGLFVIPIILSVLAIIFGWAALTDIDRNARTSGKGLAIAGIVIGIIGLIIGVIGVVVAASYNWLIVYLY
jgi:hypothetical protein